VSRQFRAHLGVEFLEPSDERSLSGRLDATHAHVFGKRADHLRLDVDERAKNGLQMRVRDARDSIGIKRLAIPRNFDQLVQGDGWIRHGGSP
jgi:hypothetical protein